MKYLNNRSLVLCALLVLAMAAVTALLYGSLPPTIALHWDIHGKVNGYGPRAFLLFELLVMAAVLLLWVVLPGVSPARFTVDTFTATYWRIGLIVIGLLAFIQCLLLWGAWSAAVPMARWLAGGVAVFIGLVGNVMGKVRRNFWIGIRTPWTLASERVWYATHRFAARTMVGSAVLALAALLLGWPVGLCLGLPIAGTLLPAAYSLLLYRRIEGRA